MTECNNNLTHCSNLCRCGSAHLTHLVTRGVGQGGEGSGVAIELQTSDSLFTQFEDNRMLLSVII